LALKLASQGAELALADVSSNGLQATKELLAGASARCYVLDVSDPEAVYSFAQDVQRDFGRVDLLVNNAGVALLGSFGDVSLAEMEWLIKVNFWGVVYGCKYFLPVLRRQPEAHIVNISSVSGLLGFPGQTPYCASKFAIRGFTEALRQELLESNIKVTCVHPGGIRTAITANARVGSAVDPAEANRAREIFSKLNLTTPEKAADLIVDGVLRDRSRVLVGPDAVWMDRLQRVFPSRAVSIVRSMLQRTVRSKSSVPAVAN
jgi:NAD(P)-dependent dehydrogenase (short-subunit alcohol dehydrogenase family)